MLSRGILRGLQGATRSVVRPTIPPRRIPTAPQTYSPLLRRFESNGSRYRPTHPRPERPKRHTRWDPSEVGRAKPLIDSSRLASRLKSKGMAVFVIILTGGGVIFWRTHIEEVPVSGRKRFICFSEESVEAEGEAAYRSIMADAQRQGALVPEWDSRSKMVTRVMSRLIEAGELVSANAVLRYRVTYN